MQFCLANGVKVYPISKNGKWYIQSEINGVYKTFDKAITHDEIQLAVCNTWIYYFKKLKNI